MEKTCPSDEMPELGSLWLHDDRELRFVRVVNAMSPYECVGFTQPHDESIHRRLGTTWVSLADWNKWVLNARRVNV